MGAVLTDKRNCTEVLGNREEGNLKLRNKVMVKELLQGKRTGCGKCCERFISFTGRIPAGPLVIFLEPFRLS